MVKNKTVNLFNVYIILNSFSLKASAKNNIAFFSALEMI
jgi:hypothetical protein